METTIHMKASSSCNVAGSRNRAIFAGCIPRILRRILCFNSLSAFSFDDNYLKEDCNEKSDGSNTLGSSSSCNTTPGVVAKLMGLESLPLLERQRGTIIPITYQEAEDENFLIFSFESQLKKKKLGKKKKKNKEMDSNLQVDENGMRSNVLRPLNNSNYFQRNVRLKRSRVNCDTEVDSENSSPNSVLEFVEFSGHHHQQQASCSGDVTRIGNSRTQRTLCEELEKCEDSNKEKKRLWMINNNVIGFGEHSVCYVGKWDEIGMEVTKLSWVQDEIFRNGNFVKEIGVDIASLILSHLLDELINNLDHF